MKRVHEMGRQIIRSVQESHKDEPHLSVSEQDDDHDDGDVMAEVVRDWGIVKRVSLSLFSFDKETVILIHIVGCSFRRRELAGIRITLIPYSD